MTGVDYNALALMSQQLLEANGKPLTIIIRSTLVINADQPWRGTNSATQIEVPVIGVVVPFHLQRLTEYTEELQEIIRRGGMRGLVAAKSTNGNDLQTAETLIDSSTGYKWNIRGLKVIQPGTVKLLYEFVLAR